MDEAAPPTTRDAFYGGRLQLRQPAEGHRSGTDAVLLAAAVPRDAKGFVIDVGAGVGVAGLGVAVLCPAARVLLVENEPNTLRLAEVNIVENGLAGRASVALCDIFDRDQRRSIGSRAEVVITNPPFHEATAVRRSPSANRDAAHVLAKGTTLGDWLEGCLDLLAPKGALIVIHAASALPEILTAFGRRLGAISLMAIHARAEAPARRVVVRGIEGRRSPLTIASPLILHDGEGFSRQAEAIHRGAGLPW